MQSSMSRFCLEKAVRLDGVEYTFIAARALLKSPERYVIGHLREEPFGFCFSGSRKVERLQRVNKKERSRVLRQY